MAIVSDFPVRENLVSGPEAKTKFPWLITERWRVWLRDLLRLIQLIPSVVPGGVVTLAAQNASIGTTPIPTENLEAGLYRITWYARITTPAGVSSSLTISIFWTDTLVACSYSGAAMTGNTVTTVQSETKMVQIDQASPISYSTTYASNAAGAMQYTLRIALEQVVA